LLGGALGGFGFAGFMGLRHLDVAAAAMQTQAPAVARAAVPAAVAPASKPPEKQEKVKIWFFTVPAVPAELRWGKKKLGIVNPPKGPKKPFFIERPKDSGPMDVIVRAEGFIPLNTRVFTYNDNKVWLKLTPEAEKNKVLGYRIEIRDGGTEGGADGGVAMPGPGQPQPLQPVPGAPPLPPGTPPPVTAPAAAAP
jgi:hypothetical protein